MGTSILAVDVFEKYENWCSIKWKPIWDLVYENETVKQTTRK